MTNEFKRPLPRAVIASMPPGNPGKIPPHRSVEPIKLSHNESSYGPSQKALAAYRSVSNVLNRYPDGAQYELRQSLAQVHGLGIDRIICGNGSEELLGLLVRAYLEEADEILLTENHFIMCTVYAGTQGASIILVPEENNRINVASVLVRVSARTRMVIVANPNVPTGSCLTGAEIRELHNGLPEEVLLVIDGAYMEYAGPAIAAACADLVDGSENVVMTRTFSKIYGLAGLRIGWAYCPAHVIEVLQHIRSPFNTNAAALAAATAAVRDVEYTRAISEKNTISLRRITNALTAVGIHVIPSVANFYLVGFAGSGSKHAAAAAAYLKAKNIVPGPLTRSGAQETLRITVGNESENDAVITALTEYMRMQGPAKMSGI